MIDPVRDAGSDAIFAALADPTRRRMIARLLTGEAVTATRFASDLPISRQAVRKHLSTLEEAGLVRSERVGRETRFELTPEPLADVVSWLARVEAAWDRRLAALKRQVEADTDTIDQIRRGTEEP
ncbi:MAG: metalloregulator ArsR/SmtB family transcription factor [Chloroflexota bacterium]|nr:metalloregulator ArsR/SmtB family transcription factor [Chloroflexota bacterium]